MNAADYEFKNGRLKVAMEEKASGGDFDRIRGLLEEKEGVKILAIDMRGCSYIQSKSLAELAALKKTASAMKLETELLNVNELIFQILETTGMQGLFTIRNDYSSFSVDELSERFLDAVEAQNVSDYLALNYDEEVRAKLIKIIEENDPVKTEYAILTMGRAQDFSDLSIFRKSLDDPDSSVKMAAILAVGLAGDSFSKEKLYGFLTDGDKDLAEGAAASIALLSDDADPEKLEKYLNSSDRRVRMIAAQALSLIGGEAAYEMISARLAAETDEEVRASLVKKLALFNIEEVCENLVKFLDDSSIAVREAAASGIVRIGPGKYVDTILKKVTDKDNWVGFFAAKSLAGVCDGKTAEALKAAYPQVEQNVKLAIIEVLGKYGDDGEFLLSKIEDENEDIRKEALNAMRNSGLPEAVKEAAVLYEKDPSWIVRYKAAEIILTEKPAGYAELLRSGLKNETNRYVREKVLGAIGE